MINRYRNSNPALNPVIAIAIIRTLKVIVLIFVFDKLLFKFPWFPFGFFVFRESIEGPSHLDSSGPSVGVVYRLRGLDQDINEYPDAHHY